MLNYKFIIDHKNSRAGIQPHQIVLSKKSLPGIEVLIEKLLSKILGGWGRRTPLKDYAKFHCAHVRRQFQYDFHTLRTSLAKTSVCMQGSQECCPVCVCIPELFV